MSGNAGQGGALACKTVAAVRLDGIHKAYGTVCALSGLDVTLAAGEIHAFLGSNGAGKTTAIGIMTGLRRADSGSVEVLGGDPQDVAVRRRIGLTPQESGFPNNLRVSEIIRLVRAHYTTPLSDADLFAQFPLQAVWRRQAGGLSGGQKRTLAVALAFVGNPDLVFLDEPTTGLDVTARQTLWQAVLRYRNTGGTAVLTTHYLEEAEALASRVVVMCKGRAVAEGTVDDIRAQVGQSRITYRGEARAGLPGVTWVERIGEEVAVLAYDADAVVRALVTHGVPFSELQVRPASLEEAFVAITEGNIS
jgi:ABC-2 type transport system ATP-binding protein